MCTEQGTTSQEWNDLMNWVGGIGPKKEPALSPEEEEQWKQWIVGIGAPSKEDDDIWALPVPPQQSHTQDEWSTFISADELQDVWKLPIPDPEVDTEYEAYLDVMKPYYVVSDRKRFINHSPDIGYKVHLNVAPQNLNKVADFLKSQNFEHKYLNGGEISSGKVFTVYLGSKADTERDVKKIYEAVGDVLEEPKAGWELEYAPGIVGRFCGEGKYFRQYGRGGISYLNSGQTAQKDPEYIKSQIAKAQEKSTELYGDYYGGGITPYIPADK